MKALIPETAIIVRKRQETQDVVTFWVKGDCVSDFLPGQFVMVSLPGFEEAPVSIAGSENSDITVTVKGVGRLTNELCSLPVGSEIGIRGPYGNGFPIDEASDRPLILVAGGIGLPPLWSVTGADKIKRTPDKVTLLYGTKRESDIIYGEELKSLKGTRVLQAVERPAKEWKGHTGYVHQLLQRVESEILREATVFACGPEVMYGPLTGKLEESGVGDNRIYLSFERQMRCGVGKCLHCYQGGKLVCVHGPVFRADEAKREGFLQ